MEIAAGIPFPLNLHFVTIASYSGVCIDPRYGIFTVIQGVGLCASRSFLPKFYSTSPQNSWRDLSIKLFPKRSSS